MDNGIISVLVLKAMKHSRKSYYLIFPNFLGKRASVIKKAKK